MRLMSGDVVQFVGMLPGWIYERHAHGGGDGNEIHQMTIGDIGLVIEVIEASTPADDTQLVRLCTKNVVGWRRWVMKGYYQELNLVSRVP